VREREREGESARARARARESERDSCEISTTLAAERPSGRLAVLWPWLLGVLA